MTCRGYDPKAVKVGKEIKSLLGKIQDKHLRGQMMRDYVRVYESNLRSGKRTKEA
jgi:hypothetical protein